MAGTFMGLKIEGKGEIPKALADAVKSKKESIEEVDLFPYSIKNTGIFKKVPSKDDPNETVNHRLSCTPFNIVAKGDNIDTKAIMFKILVRDLKGRNHFIWKSTGELLTRAGLLELMTKDHFTFKEAVVSDMENLFDQYISTAHHELPEEITASRSGWKNDNELFVCGSTGYTKNEVSTVLQLENNTADMYTQKGTIENWKVGAEELLKYDAVRFKAYASCTPMLLSLLGVQSFTVEQIGLSGMLKTLSHSVCASMFGNPKELLLNARSTPKGIEAFVGFNTDLPTFIDETSTNPDDIKDLVYTIANGVGRSTSNKSKGYEMPKTWNTVVLTTGEHPILPTNAKMGQLVRIIPLKEGVSEHLEQDIIESIEKAVRENYGLLRDLIIKEIFDNKEKISDIYTDHFNCFKTPEKNSNTDSRAKRFYAAIATAGFILENVFADIGIKQKNPFDIVNKYYTDNVIASTVFVPDHERALNAFYSWFATKKSLFEENNEHSNHDVYGAIENDGTIQIVPNVLEKTITDLGYNFKGCENNWKKEGTLLTYPHSKKDPTLEIKWVRVINKIKTTVYRIKSQDTSKYEEEEGTEVNKVDNRETRKPKYSPRAKRIKSDLNNTLDVSQKEITESIEKEEDIFNRNLYTKEMIDRKEYEIWKPVFENGDTVYKNIQTGETKHRDLCTEDEFAALFKC